MKQIVGGLSYQFRKTNALALLLLSIFLSTTFCMNNIISTTTSTQADVKVMKRIDGESFHLKSERRMLFRNIRVTLSRRGGERDKLDEKVRQLKQLQLKSPAPQFILMHLSSAFQSLWGQNTRKLMKNGQPNIFPSKKLPNRDTATLPKETKPFRFSLRFLF